MFFKILRKAGLGLPALKLAKPFIKADTVLPSVEEAGRQLSALSPDPGSSCLWDKGCEIRGDFELDIIVPAYNVEKYIKRCIDSALSQQTKYSFRLIIIDDGSTDATPGIIDSYAEDKHVLIRHQENLGLAGARNTGLRLSDSEYVMFLDSDDFLPPGSIEALLQAVAENSTHNIYIYISEGAFAQCDTAGKQLSLNAHKSGRLDPRSGLYGFACMKVFRAELFEQLCFPQGYLYEDSIMAQIIYPLCEKRGYTAWGVADCVYNYTVNPAGITASSRSRPKSIDSLWITLALYKDRQKLGLVNDQAYYEYILSMLILSYRRTGAQSEDIKKAMFVVWKDFLEREFSDFRTENSKHKILEQAVRERNFPLYRAACELI